MLREFTEQFKKRYDVECVSALHHNMTKKNYHIHDAVIQLRLAGYLVGTGEITIDEAVAGYGTFTQ